MIKKEAFLAIHDKAILLKNNNQSPVYKKRVLGLSHYPRHSAMLTEIAAHYTISKSRAFQLILAYTENIYSLKKQMKHYYDEKGGAGDIRHLWTDFDKEASNMLSTRIDKMEVTYTVFAKLSISRFYLMLKEGALSCQHKAFKEYLPNSYAIIL